jgi:hypothetical protein
LSERTDVVNPTAPHLVPESTAASPYRSVDPPKREAHIVVRVVRKAAGEIAGKLNVFAAWREIKAKGKKYGKRFIVAAAIWEFGVEDGLFPLLAWLFGVPGLIPLLLLLHFEPVVWPCFIWCFRTWDRMKGREPWEPDRSAQSSALRSATKTLLYEVVVSGWYAAILLDGGLRVRVLVAYAVVMSLFGVVHERIWHDENYGIDADDNVAPRRVVAKTCTYAVVSAMVMGPVFFAAFGRNLWGTVAACQAAGAALYGAFELVWSRNRWGVTPVPGYQRTVSEP